MSDPQKEDPQSQPEVQIVKVPGSRRAQRPLPAGADPHPQDHLLTARASEDRPEVWGEKPAVQATKPSAGKPGGKTRGENDDRLQQDRPPHWG